MSLARLNCKLTDSNPTLLCLSDDVPANRIEPRYRSSLECSLIACTRRGDTLVVWKLDRLALSMNQLIMPVEDLKIRGVGFWSLTEAIDTTNAAGELFFNIFGTLAQFERSIIRDRTNAGLAAALARGRKGGRKQRVTEDDIGAALALVNDPKIFVRKTAKRLSISVSTLYRYAPGLRSLVGANPPAI